MEFFGRGEILGLAIADIGFGRSLIRPVGRGLDTVGGYARHVRREASCSVFLQEFLDDALDLAVLTLTEVMVANSPFSIDEILGRPSLVIERPPNLVVGVYGDRVGDLQITHGCFDVFAFL